VMSASTAARSQGFGQVQSKSQSGLKRPIWAAELSDGSQHLRTLEEAETALRYLIKKMAVVDGDLVSAHPRFAYPRHRLSAAPRSGCSRGGAGGDAAANGDLYRQLQARFHV
jgi:hypothetical protein